MKKVSILIFCLIFLILFARAYNLPGATVLNNIAQATPPGSGFSAMGITVAGGNGRGSAANQLINPLGIFVDPAGNIYITDQRNSRIQKWAPGASAGITVAGGNGTGSAPNQLNEPFDVFVDPAGNIYIDEANGARVERWAPGASSGTIVAGNNGRGSAANQLNDPFAIFLDAAGNIYISDQINGRVQKWAPGASSGITVAGGNGLGSAANQLSITTGVFVNSTGDIYVSDGGNHRVQKWVAGATSGITVAGGNGMGSAANQLNPGDVFVDAAGNIYVADVDNNRIQKWAPGASAGVTVAGGNGSGSAADQLSFPSSIFLDQAGNLYVSDANNNRIQKFLAEQSVSCMPDISFPAPSCSATATITWTGPHDSFPAVIAIPEELDLNRGTLIYLNSLNGHGYYKSSLAYPWPVAKDIAFYVGDTSVHGHMVSINSAAENSFLVNQIKGLGYAPWIGLYNNGKPGQFSWVTDEPSGYANWAPGEPNNFQGNGRNLREFYVRLSDTYGNWNDQRSDNVPFIAEFEEPLIRYRQISGPANGSSQGVGVYRVCYEKTNYITDEKDTCCFSVTITCAASALNTTGLSAASATMDKNINAATNGGLSIATSPNPSSNYFRLKITSGQAGNSIDLTVTDMLGKVVEYKKGIMPDQTLEIGMQYKPGVYFASVVQGNKKVMIKIVKQ